MNLKIKENTMNLKIKENTMSRSIINLINFIRGCEPRNASIDLVGTMRKELELAKKHGLKTTILFQYDALIQKEFRDTVAEFDHDGMVEIGMWVELVRTCTIKGGAEWTGRDQEWDWGARQCNLIGHTPEKRKSILDECMRAFYECYGRYPAVIGAWSLDAVSLIYLKEKYGVKGACICKEQFGTDSYTLWGGYYFGAYYPSKNNVLAPAQTLENQIDIPLFRMLGSDPIYQYDYFLDMQAGPISQGVITLEPAYIGRGGGDPNWVDWFLKENFNKKALGYTYAQAGQENSFGWDWIGGGLTYQVEEIARLQKEGKLECLTFGETVEWFKNTYKQTPATSLLAETDWKQEGRETYWYENKNYRINVMKDDTNVWVRDMFLFDEKYPERYLTQALDKDYYVFDNLPVVDGFRWSGNGIRCGVYFVGENGKNIFGNIAYEKGENEITITIQAEQSVTCNFNETEIAFKSDKEFVLRGQADTERVDTHFSICNGKICMQYRGHDYALFVRKGIANIEDGNIKIRSENGEVSIQIVR
jgi:hypothetical protein